MVLDRNRPSRDGRTFNRILAPSGCGDSSACPAASSSSTWLSNLSSAMVFLPWTRWSEPASEQIAAAPDGSARGRRTGASRKTCFDSRDPPDQLSGGLLGSDNFGFNGCASIRSERGALGLALEPGNQFAHALFDLLDLLLEASEGVLDVLDGQVLGHHRAHLIHAADDLGGIHPARAAVLALAPDAHRTRQKTELHVLAQGGLGEAKTPRGAEILDQKPRRPAPRNRALAGGLALALLHRRIVTVFHSVSYIQYTKLLLVCSGGIVRQVAQIAHAHAGTGVVALTRRGNRPRPPPPVNAPEHDRAETPGLPGRASPNASQISS